MIKLTVQDLMKRVKWVEVKKALDYHYPEITGHRNNYKPVFEHLQKIKRSPQRKGTFFVTGGIHKAFFERPVHPANEKFINDFLNEQIKEKESITETYYKALIVDLLPPVKWSCSFVPWKRMVNLPVNLDTLSHYTFEEIIAHFLWEITFYGLEKDMKTTGKKILARAKSVNIKDLAKPV